MFWFHYVYFSFFCQKVNRSIDPPILCWSYQLLLLVNILKNVKVKNCSLFWTCILINLSLVQAMLQHIPVRLLWWLKITWTTFTLIMNPITWQMTIADTPWGQETSRYVSILKKVTKNQTNNYTAKLKFKLSFGTHN